DEEQPMTPKVEYDTHDQLYALVAGLCVHDYRSLLADASDDLDASLDLMAAFNLIADIQVPARAVPVDHVDEAAQYAAATVLIDRLLTTTEGLPDRLALLELADLLASARSRSEATVGERR